MMASCTTRSLIATGLAVCCALAPVSNARAEALDGDDSAAVDVAELVQWHSGTSASNDFCGAREGNALYANYRHVFAAFLAMHGVPGVPETNDADASLGFVDTPDFSRNLPQGFLPR
jgi:hypothetical protein